MTWLTCDRCKAETGEEIEAEESTGFGYDGYSYALDLCAPHAEDFHGTVEAMIGWSSQRSRIGTGRRSGRSMPSGASQSEVSPPRRTPADRERLRAIREWARSSGYELGDRGRIPQNIVAEYEAGHVA
jgi:hypothetical protein